ncbi:MAG: LacI family transcriptional regulator [Deltaproteobacteria bacterium]|nr:LacI family transcriptional regulator [Deltaproteobacteria bacterium]
MTLADVARVAGVSPATVSMILSGREGVSFAEETVAAVLAAAEALRYKTVANRRLSSPEPDRRTILIAAPNVTNPYYATLIQAIQQAADENGCGTCVVTTYRSLEDELAALRLAEHARFTGIIFTLLAHPDEIIPRLNRKIPVVVIGDRSVALDVDTVELNNYDAGSLIARHMHELGHRHIAYISTTLDRSNTIRSQRLQGLQDTFATLRPDGSVLVKSRDIDPGTELHNMAIEHAVGYELARRCFPETAITAFVAVNDMVAYGVIDAVRDAGLSVPGDYSVCGFDNVFPSRFAGVSLTTVEHYIKDKGRNAFEILYAKISGASSGRNITRVEFRHELIVRGSTAPPHAPITR